MFEHLLRALGVIEDFDQVVDPGDQDVPLGLAFLVGPVSGEAALRLLVHFAATDLDFFIIGSGGMPWRPPEELRTRFRELHVSLDAMTTGPAVRTYNVMLMEGRRIGAGLIAIE